MAGELGFVVGAHYASLSGFRTFSGSGKVQLLALGGLLVRRGFQIWDLGMAMDYKLAMGASQVPRLEYLDEFREVRQLHPTSLGPMSDRMNCREFVDVLREVSKH